jgi:hypothetical protein
LISAAAAADDEFEIFVLFNFEANQPNEKKGGTTDNGRATRRKSPAVKMVFFNLFRENEFGAV